MFGPRHKDQPDSRFSTIVFKCEPQVLSNSDSTSAQFGSSVKDLTHKYENRIQFNNEICRNDDSGGFTPPLWKTSPAKPSTNDQYIDYKNLTAAQKTQAVANGQRELMEMIKNMPESSYELSLKDLVEDHYRPRNIENPVVVEAEPENNTDGDDEEIVLYRRNAINKNNKEKKNIVTNRKKSERTAQIYRSVSLDSGGLYLLKTGFPVLWGSRKKKKNNNIGDEGTRKSVDKEWWVKQRISGSRDSENGAVSSSNSGSTGSSGSGSGSSVSSIKHTTRNGHSCNPSCWSFFSYNNAGGKLE